MPRSTDVLMDMCRKLVTIRRIVGDTLGYRFCANPVCDMLFELYIARSEDRSVYLWSLCMFAHVPLSTALRKVKAMERQGLIVREDGERDRRRVGVRLSAHGSEAVERLLAQVVEASLVVPVAPASASLSIEASREARSS